MTLNVGTVADTETMQSVADIADGKHYNVPGGSGYATMYTQLKDAFREIAKARPLKLVK